MKREQKQEAIEEIGEQLGAASAVFAVDYRGISVPQAAELRGKLREADATFKIVKNRLAKRVTAERGAEVLDEHLVGPTALTYVHGDPVVAAKAISGFIKEYEILAYKGGIMDGEPLGPDEFSSIAKLPGVEVLHGQLVGLAASPLTGLVSGLNGLIQGLATQLGQIAERELVGGEAPEAEAEEEEVAAEEEAPEPEAEEKEEAPAEEEASAESEGDAEASAEEATAEGESEGEADAEGGSDAEASAEGDENASEQAEEEGADTPSDAEETETETKEDD